MPLLTIGVRNKVAESPTAHIVCGNSDYIIEFNFDEEWDSHETKTARFIYDGKQADVIFTGNTCPVPIITNARVCMVGVFAGDLQTTTPALIECEPSILCGSGVPADPTPDVYAQLLEMYDQLRKQGVDDTAIAAAIEKWLEENPIEGAEVPDTLPNPHKLTFTGAVEAEYDGSEEVTVEIPEGGGGGIEVTGAEVGQTIVVKAVDNNGKPTEWETADLPSGGSSEWVLVGEKTFTEADLGTSLFEFTCDDLTEFHIICQNLLATKEMGLSFRINGVTVTGNTGNRITEGIQWIQMDLSYRGQVWMAHCAKYEFDSAQYSQASMMHSFGKLEEGVGKAKRISIQQSNAADWQMRSGNVRIYGRQ